MSNLENNLKDIGVNNEDINYITNNISGSDMVNLTLILNKSNISDAYTKAWQILKKYNIHPQVSEVQMTEKYTISELVEWIDKNNISFSIKNNSLYLYNLNEQQIDKLHIGELFEEKTANQAKKDLEKFLSKTPRNVYATNAQLRSGSGSHQDEKNKKDRLGRDAKHKLDLKRNFNEERNFEVGEHVLFNNKDVVVKIAKGPNDTIGIVLDNELKMVGKTQVEKINEAVIGFKNMDTIGRLKELAGIRTKNTNIPDEIDEAENDMEFNHFDQDMPIDDEETDMELPTVSTEPSTVDVVPTPNQLPLSDNIGRSTNSQAYGEILDYLNNIQNCLSDIRLSEYRSLIQKLDDLTTQIRGMGRDYLGEAKKK